MARIVSTYREAKIAFAVQAAFIIYFAVGCLISVGRFDTLSYLQLGMLIIGAFAFSQWELLRGMHTKNGLTVHYVAYAFWSIAGIIVALTFSHFIDSIWLKRTFASFWAAIAALILFYPLLLNRSVGTKRKKPKL